MIPLLQGCRRLLYTSVRVVVAAGAGSGDDFVARQVAAGLSGLLGQQFIVENRPGAGGMIGQTLVAKSPARARGDLARALGNATRGADDGRIGDAGLRFALMAGSIPQASSPQEVRKRYEDWMAIFGKIAQETGIKPH